MRATTSSCLLVSAALCACHSAADDTPGSTTSTDLLVSIAQLDCQEAFNCQGSYPGDDFIDDYGGSVEECVQLDTDPDDLQTIADDIADGMIVYDPDSANDCLTGISYSDCLTYWDDGTDLPDACDSVFIGQIVDGGACNVDFDCADALADCDDLTATCTIDTGAAPARRHRSLARLLHH